MQCEGGCEGVLVCNVRVCMCAVGGCAYVQCEGVLVCSVKVVM